MNEKAKIFFLVVGLLGAAAMVVDVWLIYWGIQSVKWPTTMGTVLRDAAKGQVRYTYIAGGKSQMCETVSYGYFYTNSNSREAVEVDQEFKKRAEVKVFYNPSHPEQAVLEPGLRGGNFGLAVAGIGLIFVGMLPWLLETGAVTPSR